MTRLTVAQAVVRFLAAQRSERDGATRPLFAGCFGIFGHGNLAGLGQALLEAGPAAGGLRYVLARNEQAMVHAAAGYARMCDRLQTWACTSSVGPGATNMVTGAALATINRLPVLLLPGDVFATRPARPVLQELEHPAGYDVSVNDTLRPVSVFFDRIWRPEQLPSALLAAMRVLTDPAQAGAVTLALPQDVQAEAHDWPGELFAPRIWHVARPAPEPAAVHRAAAVIRAAARPLLVAGGGVIYSRGHRRAAGVRRGHRRAGRRDAGGQGCAALRPPAGGGRHRQHRDHRGQPDGAPRRRHHRRRHPLHRLHHRLADRVRRSRGPVRQRQRGRAGRGQAGGHRAGSGRPRRTARAPPGPGRWATAPGYQDQAARLAADWDRAVTRAYTLGHQPRPAQSEVIGVVNEVSGPRDVVLCAAGSLPGDLHKLWRTRDAKGYHAEYGYSCMGYEIAGGLGVKLAAPDRDVYVLVGDGSYLMMCTELVTAVQEGIKLIVVLVQNHGFASIGALSETVGAARFGTRYRYRDPATGQLDGGELPVDLAANAASLGARVWRAQRITEFRDALREARDSRHPGPVLVQIETDPLAPAPSSEAWWDVPVAEVSGLDATGQARQAYQAAKAGQRQFLAADPGPGRPRPEGSE